MSVLQGSVNRRGTPRVRLQVRGPDGYQVGVTAVVDTGFTGRLTLPDATIADLGLVLVMFVPAYTADGRRHEVGLYDAEIEWGGDWLPVRVTAAGGTEVLLGVGLLYGHRLQIDVVSGGAVEITPLG